MAADTMIPDPYDGQSYNRYTYTDNRPLSFTDPTGNEPSWFDPNTDPNHWTGNNGAHADPDAHPEMEEFGGFTVSETHTLGGDTHVTITRTSDGDSRMGQDPAKNEVTMSARSDGTQVQSNCDPKSVALTGCSPECLCHNEQRLRWC